MRSRKAGHDQAEIAKIMGRDPGTISRELRRNRGPKGYRPRQAHHLALMRRCNKVQPRISNEIWQQVEALMFRNIEVLVAQDKHKITVQCVAQCGPKVTGNGLLQVKA